MHSLWKIPIPQQFRQPKLDLEITLVLDYLRGTAMPSSMSPKSCFGIFSNLKNKQTNKKTKQRKQKEPPNQPTNKQIKKKYLLSGCYEGIFVIIPLSGVSGYS